jgi:hypothetical protein
MNETDVRMGSLVLRLQRWFERECNGDWEHSYGITIETLDNPGWLVKIDLHETAWVDTVLTVSRGGDSEVDWAHCAFSDGRFISV